MPFYTRNISYVGLFQMIKPHSAGINLLIYAQHLVQSLCLCLSVSHTHTHTYTRKWREKLRTYRGVPLSLNCTNPSKCWTLIDHEAKLLTTLAALWNSFILFFSFILWCWPYLQSMTLINGIPEEESRRKEGKWERLELGGKPSRWRDGIEERPWDTAISLM